MDKTLDIKTLLDQACSGNKRAAARLITLAENDVQKRFEIIQSIYPKTGGAYIIGITGPPGAGKSTLTKELAKLIRKNDKRVGIIAVDPSSPFSGGAILGDRIRMNDLTLDDGVYIRSMGTRGYLGGLSASVESTVMVFDACGCDFIVIETVGAGQSEVDIVKMADTTIVVSVPGLGDDIQIIKAGILEIADIHVVNKADREGAEQVRDMLYVLQQLGEMRSDKWIPPIILTSAQKSEGIVQLYDKILEHKKNSEKSDRLHETRKERLKNEILSLLQDEIGRRVCAKHGFDSELLQLIDEMYQRHINPYDWAEEKINQCV